MRLLKRLMSTAVASAALLAVGQANADQLWQWSYSGAGVTASGTLTTAGPATTYEDILSITGQRNGVTILGLVPLDTDENFVYDNQFKATGEHFTSPGMLFDIGGAGPGNVNVYYDGGQAIDLVVDGLTPIETPITFTVTAVPEAATLAYMGLGLAGVAFAARRTRRREEEAATA